MKQRDIPLDILRVLACIMVVAIHSPLPSENANGVFLTALSYFTAPCIGLFFMVSGALLLPVKGDYVPFLKRRLGKIIWPTVIWTIIYIALNLSKNPDRVNIVQTLLSVPFSAQGHGVLWFMYTLTGLYLIAPLLSPWLEKASKKDLQIVMALWALTLCYPVLEELVGIRIDESQTGVLYYFGGYAGYFLLGYYLKNYPGSIPFPIAAFVAVAGIAGLLLTKWFNVDIDFYRMFWCLSIFIVALCVVVWKSVVFIVKYLSVKELRLTVRISNLSFGIYLCHILIMREILWNISLIRSIDNYILQSFVIFGLTFILSVAVCEFLSRMPFAQFIIAYKKTRRERNLPS